MGSVVEVSGALRAFARRNPGPGRLYHRRPLTLLLPDRRLPRPRRAGSRRPDGRRPLRHARCSTAGPQGPLLGMKGGALRASFATLVLFWRTIDLDSTPHYVFVQTNAGMTARYR